MNAWKIQTDRTGKRPTRRERMAGKRFIRGHHRPGRVSRYTAEQEQDRLIVASVARDLLELIK